MVTSVRVTTSARVSFVRVTTVSVTSGRVTTVRRLQ